MKLCLMQIAPPSAPAETLSALAGWATAAAAQGAAALVLPELVLPGYNRPAAHRDLAEPQGGPWQDAVARIARAAGIAICYGWAERDGAAVYNVASVIGADGTTLAHYRKIQLFGPMEHASFIPGTEAPPVFELAGRRCGLLICYDIEFPEHARALGRRGVDLLLVPTANPEGYPHVPDLLVPARAYENRMVVAYANYAGDDNGLRFGGGSVVVGPDGQALARSGTTPAVLTVELPAPGALPEDRLSTQIADLRLPG